MLGQVELDDLLINRDEINCQLQTIIDELTDPWGVKVTLVEVKDVELPETMRRAMGRQAEAERERRSKVIHAEGEREARRRSPSAAADVLDRSPGAMQLRCCRRWPRSPRNGTRRSSSRSPSSYCASLRVLPTPKSPTARASRPTDSDTAAAGRALASRLELQQNVVGD